MEERYLLVFPPNYVEKSCEIKNKTNLRESQEDKPMYQLDGM